MRSLLTPLATLLLSLGLSSLGLVTGCSRDPGFAPVADAGDDAVVALGSLGSLDGSGSFDHDGEVETWTWTLLSSPEGSSAVAEVDGRVAGVVPDRAGTWTFGLVVTDDQGTESLMDVASVHGVLASQPPVARLSATGVLGVGLSTTLDASDSFDPEGEPLSFTYLVVIAPGGSAPELTEQGDSAGFVPDRPGFYVVGVVANDGAMDSVRADVELLVTNTPNRSPVADCGLPQQVDVGQEALLDGSGSFDPDGDGLSYAWELIQAPQDSAATLDDPTLAQPTLLPDVEGAWYLSLVVSDGTLVSEACQTTVRAGEGGPNNAPVALAGLDSSATVGQVASVDGGASFDPDGDPLTHAWALVSVPAGSTLTDADLLVEVTQAAFAPDVAGDFVLELTVCDGEPLCDTDEVTLTAVEGGNTAPIANAGADQGSTVGQTLTFYGGASTDPDGDPITFQWSLLSAPSGSGLSSTDIGNAQGAVATLVPDVQGNYALQLRVCDPFVCSTDAVLGVVGGSLNSAPIADAGADGTATAGAVVVLDGGGSSDPDGDPITFVWLFSSKPQGSALTYSDISDRKTDAPSFTPDVAGDYVLRLTVDDGALNDTDTVRITATGSPNTSPIADAGADLGVDLGNIATLDGSASSDPDGDPISYAWVFNGKPSSSSLTYTDITDRLTATPSFTPDVVGEFTLRLRVSDGTDTDDDGAVVAVTQANTAPVADAGTDQSSCAATTVTLDGSGSSDPEGDPISYAWVFNSKPSSSALTYSDISDRTSASPSFTPDVSGTYVLRLTVNDGTDSDTDTVQVVFGPDDATVVLHLDDSSGFTATDDGPSSLSVTADVDDWAGAPFFGGLAFQNNALTVPDGAETDLSSDFTIEWWMRATPGNTSYQALFVKGGSFNSYNLFRYLDSGFYVYALDSNNGVTYGFVSGASMDDSWHHYAVVVDSSHTWTLYEDGVSLGTVTGSAGVATNNDDLSIGAFPSVATYDFEGVLDEVILRDQALTSTEVAAQASATSQFCTEDEDNTAPTLTITTSSTTTDQPYVAVEGTASDDGAVVAVSVDGVEAISTSGDFDTWVAFLPLSSGANTLSADADDFFGNASSASTVTVTFDDDCTDEYTLWLAFDDDGSGLAEDYSPRANDGTESGVDRVIGVYGNAASFDGGGTITVPDAGSLDVTKRFTLDFWYRSESTSSEEGIADKGENYSVFVDGDDLYCSLVDGDGTEQTLVGVGFNDGDWHHVTCSWNLSNWRMFVDGAKEDDLAVSVGPVANTEDLLLGDGFNGQLDGFRLNKGNSVALAGADALRTEGELCLPSANLGGGATATASASASTNYGPSALLDGDTSEDDNADETYWLLPQGTTGYIDVDLGEVYGLTTLRWANTHHGPRYTQATEDYEILVSTTGAFTGEEELFDYGSGDMETELMFHQVESASPVPGRYIRITVDSYHSMGGGLNELEVYGL